jgi:hypothetical protein
LKVICIHQIFSQYPFLIWKSAIFRKIKGTKHLSWGVVLYAAQSNGLIDAEIAEKGGFQTETSCYSIRRHNHHHFD